MEVWKTIPGYDGIYEISDRGRVRSLDRMAKGSNGIDELHHGCMIKLHARSNYLYVALHKDGTSVSYDVHRLVAESFVEGKTSERAVVNHKNLNKHDNRAENLEWVTESENCRHAWENGAMQNHVSQRVKKAIVCVETERVFQSSFEAAGYLNDTVFQNTKDIPTMARNIRHHMKHGRMSYGYHWRDFNKEPSTTIPKGSTPKRVEMGDPS